MGAGPADALKRAGGALLLLIPLAIAAFLRLDRLGVPSLWLDEILGYQFTGSSAARPWLSWLIGFDAEHGPLYYATQWLTRFVDPPEVAARLPAALFGIAAVAMSFRAAKTARNPGGGTQWTAFVAAALLATSPLHVYYSREARPYALSMLLATCLIAALLSSRALWPIVLLMVATLYTSATAAPLLAGVAVVSLVLGIMEKRRRDWIITAVAIALCACVPLLYRGRSAATFGPEFPGLSTGFFTSLAKSFAVSGLDRPEGDPRVAIAFFVLALAGGVVAWRRDRRTAIVVTGLMVVPIVAALAGLAMYQHWFSVRYVAPALPAYIVLIATAITSLRFARPAISIVAIVWIAATTAGAAHAEPRRKLAWREIASAIAARAHPGDLVIAAESWSHLSLGFYLDRIPKPLRRVVVTRRLIAEALVAKQQPAWVVTAGYSTEPAVAEWACSYPVILASPLESFRLHYVPSAQHFLQHRSSPQERRAFSAAQQHWIYFGLNDDFFLGDGWGTPEGGDRDSFRWILGTRATLLIPDSSRQSRVVTLHALPMSHATLPAQRVTVLLNGNELTTLTMTEGWADYAIPAPAATWLDGTNVLELRAARANAPASLGQATDARPLSVAIRTMALSERADPHLPSVRTVRLAALTPRASGRTRFALGQLNRDAVASLLGRLGFDPIATSRRLERGETTLEDLAVTIATASACEDDLSFARRAYAILMRQVPNAAEDASLLRMQRTGTREELVRHILQKPEFVAKLR
jgi:hypothetical protein